MNTVPSAVMAHSQHIIPLRAGSINSIAAVADFSFLYLSVSYMKTEYQSLQII
jgi:hypothetical protein